MRMTAETLLAEALEMPPHMRAFVVERLIESLDIGPEVELSGKWREVIAGRCREMDEGTVELRDADAVFAKAFAELG